ncbi:hypothetical protein C4561_01530 [candidate division WWE3 bacterium]|uniref:Uncharacterized protein n=1 Tax=candidate division WWE3 bacterium TaxID=2053526 RepID=A0A3A4ZF11_UNCKA|nr:MAG: hypothetical protein C4561_01530 [candidate division WWE3 bacterium]
MKFALLIVLVALIVIPSVSEAIATRYDRTQTGLDSLESSSIAGGFSRGWHRVFLTKSGDVLINGYMRFNFGQSFYKSSDWGTTWIYDTITGLTATTAVQNFSWFFDDSGWALNAASASGVPWTIRRYDRTVAGILDTVTTTGGASSATRRPMLTVVGGKLMVVVNNESTPDDSALVTITTGQHSQDATWYRAFKSKEFTGGGLKLPHQWGGGSGGGILATNMVQSDFYWVDSLYGFDTLHLAFKPGNDPYLRDCWVMPLLESTGVLVYQSGATSGTDTLVSFNYVVQNTGDGTGGNVSITLSNRQVVETHQGIKNGNQANVTGGTFMPGGDSAVCFYKYWPDTTVDSPSIVGKVFNGSSWGSSFYVSYGKMRSTLDSTIEFMQASPYLWKIGDYYRYVIAHTDSCAGDTSKGTVFLGTIYAPSGELPAVIEHSGTIHNKTDGAKIHDASSVRVRHGED